MIDNPKGPITGSVSKLQDSSSTATNREAPFTPQMTTSITENNKPITHLVVNFEA
jgi:hypothetical protein